MCGRISIEFRGNGLLYRSLMILTASSIFSVPMISAADPASQSQEVFVNFSNDPLPGDGGLAEKQVALTFDDGPRPETTLRILATLKKFNVKATFFEVGRDAEAHPEVTK